MKDPLFHIIIRTSNRPVFFSNCIRSIQRQTYDKYKIIVGYDDELSGEYVERYPFIQATKVQPMAFTEQARPASYTQVNHQFLPNLYMNDLLKLTDDGFIIFLDDDDYLRSSESLKTISNHIQSDDDLILWRTQFSPQEQVPDDHHFGEAPKFSQINTSGFCFHSKYIQYAEWDSFRGSDYFVAAKLHEVIPNKILIDQALTGTQMNNGLSGKGDRKDLTQKTIKENFDRDGFIDSISILQPSECLTFLNNIKLENALPSDWDKGRAIPSRYFFELASHPKILSYVKQFIGDNIILWGASLIHRDPGQVHAWHCDAETRNNEPGKTVSVWLGIENCNRKTSLQVVRCSHKLKKSVQECRSEKGAARHLTTTDQVISWAKEEIEESDVVQCDTLNGEVLFFDGRIWHYSKNESNNTRIAVLLQYATPDKEIRILNLRNLDWPFEFLEVPRPPCLLLSGSDDHDVNRIVKPPISKQTHPFNLEECRIEPLRIPLPALDDGIVWQPYHMIRGETPCMEDFSCHVSTLAPNNSPHPPHQHKEEEILMVLKGEVALELPDLSKIGKASKVSLKEGEYVYYPSFFWHTLTTIGDVPANYLMLKWHNVVKHANEVGYKKRTTISYEDRINEHIKYGVLIDGQTDGLTKLQSHTTILQPGKGYKPHSDAYDVIIIVLEGMVQTLGSIVKPYGVIYCPAGSSHGMFNPSEKVAKYIVFEFHGYHGSAPNLVNQEENIRLLSETNSKLESINSELGKKIVENSRLLTDNKTQLSDMQMSYSWKIGRAITKSVHTALGWIPFFRKLYK